MDEEEELRTLFYRDLSVGDVLTAGTAQGLTLYLVVEANRSAVSFGNDPRIEVRLYDIEHERYFPLVRVDPYTPVGAVKL